MFVKKLTIEQFGRIGYKSFSFEQPLIVFAGKETEEIFAALCVALGNRILRFQTTMYRFTEKSKIYAEIEKSGKVYTVEAVYDEGAPEYCSVCIYHGGRQLSDEERATVFRTSIEEEECSYYINRYDYYRYVPFAELDFTKKLAVYRLGLQEENRKEFSERTDGIGNTYTFRKELKKFHNKFFTLPISLYKQIWLTLEEDGTFVAEDVRPRKDLSAAEKEVLQYLSFIEVNRFWGEVQKTMGRTIRKPLFIKNLPYYINYCVDMAPLMEQTLALGRQIFLFMDNRDDAQRQFSGIVEKQIICCEQI